MEHTTPQSETLNVLTGNRIAAMMTDEVEMGNLVDLPEGAPTWSGIGVITPPDDTFKEQPQQEDNGSQSARPALLPKQDETPQQVLGLGQAPIEQSGIASFDCSSYDFSDRSPLLLPELSPQLIDGVVNAAELVYDHDENSSTITSARTESIAARDSLDYTADIGLSPVAESVTAHIEDADEEPSAYIRRGSLGSPRLGESTGCHSDSDHTISSNATASSGKCRAVSSSFEPAPIQRLPDSVLKRIFVLLAMPEGVELPNNVQEKGDAACWAWQLLKWRRWGGTLRLVCKTWTPLGEFNTAPAIG